MKTLRLLSLLLFMFISGCEGRYLTTANGPIFFEAASPFDQNGLVCIYHGEVETDLEPSPTIKINDKEFFTLAKNGYSFAYLSSGIHKLSVISSRCSLVTELAIDPRQTIFMRFDYTFSGITVLRRVHKDKALNEIQQHRFIKPIRETF